LTQEERSANPLARHGGLSYLEIPASDPGRSAVFYANVLGWQIDQRAEADFRFADARGLLIGRWVSGRAASGEAGPLPFFYVDRLDAALAAAQDGGEVVKPAYREGDVLVAWIRDPAGNVLGLWQFERG
jgi:predicted enzyme related to lactoylglutathione lyase